MSTIRNKNQERVPLKKLKDTLFVEFGSSFSHLGERQQQDFNLHQSRPSYFVLRASDCFSVLIINSILLKSCTRHKITKEMCQ